MGSPPDGSGMQSPGDALQRARALYQAGEWDGAEKLCTSILQVHPQHLDAIGLLGIIAAQTQRAPRALDLLGRLVAARPDDPFAQSAYANVLRLLTRFDEALAGYERALQLKPDYAEAYFNRGNVLQDLQRLQAALDSYQSALQFKPDYAEAHHARGNALLSLGRPEEALQSYQRALQAKPDYPEAHNNRGSTLLRLGRLEEALQSYERALELNPAMQSAPSLISYGELLSRLGRTSQALDFYRRWHEVSPDNPIAKHNLAAMGGAQCPQRAADEYVRETFDDYADSFDRRLEQLQYRTPQLLHDAVLSSGVLRSPGGLDVLDIGCGTGLCAPLLRPLAKRLVGVDLSPKMLSKAAARGLYDQLSCAELTDWLCTCDRTFDLAVAADVFCYFGDLSIAFSRVRAALASGGCFACSLEATPEDDTSRRYVLRPHGRYQHAFGYVQSVLAEAGLEGRRTWSGILRHERGEPVLGHLIVAVRP